MNASAKPQGVVRSSTVGYEPRDLNVKWIALSVGILIGTAIILHFALAWLLAIFARQTTVADRQMTQHQAAPSVLESGPSFPGPRLQIAPERDLQALREREDLELNSYGWVNLTSG